MLRKPGQTDSSARSRPSRRKTQESADDIVRKLQRLPCNKKCADCMAKLPQSVNMSHGTFVCMACSGVHREFNHRIKGIGHSSFSVEEATFLSSHGNDVVNTKLLANFSQCNERLRAPDGSSATVDGQLLRVWLRRKYIDYAWKSRDSVTKNDTSTPSTTSNNSGSSEHQSQPTRAKIPAKKPKPAPATVDLLGDIFAESAPVPVAPVDDQWNAFGGSTSNTVEQKPFDTNFGQGDQLAQSQHHSNFPNNNAGPPSNFQPTFDQSNFNPTSQPGMHQGHTNLPHQHPSSHPPAQYQQPDFNANFPSQAQPQQQGSSGMGQPVFQGNLQARQPGLQRQQVQPAQTYSQPSLNGEIPLAQPSNQPQHQPPQSVMPQTQQSSTAFNTNFQNQPPSNQQHLAMTSGNQQHQSASPAHQQTQVAAPPQGQQQASYNTHASRVAPGNQQLQPHTTIRPPQQQHFQGVQSGLQQQQIQPTNTYSQPSLNPDFSTSQAGNPQLQPMPVVPPPQQNSTMTTNFQSMNQQHLNMPSENQHLQNTPSVQLQAQNPGPPSTYQNQLGFNTNFADALPVNQQHPGPNTASSVDYQQPLTHQNISDETSGYQQQQSDNFSSMQTEYQHPHTSVSTSNQETSVINMSPGLQSTNKHTQSQTTVPPNHQQSSFNANFAGPQVAVYPDQQPNVNSNYQFQQQGQPSAPIPHQQPSNLPNDANVNIQGSQITGTQCDNVPSQNIKGPVQGKHVEMHPESSCPQQIIPASAINGVDSMAPTLHTQNTMPSTMGASGTSQNAFDVFNGLGLAPNDNMEKQNDAYHNNIEEVLPKADANKFPSKYSVGQKTEYRDTQNYMSVVEIMKVHLDDSLVPFYTIKMPDGREKQTDNKHLSVCGNSIEGQTHVEAPQETVVNSELNYNVPVNTTEMPVQNGTYPKVNDIVTMLHNLNEHQLAAVHGFINEMTH